MRRLLTAVLLLACALPLAAGNKPKWAVTKRPPQTVEIPGLAPTAAAQKCENWAWAAVLSDVLRQGGLPLKQQELVLKTDAGEICLDRLGDLEARAQHLAGQYVRDDGSRVQVESRVVAGLVSPDDLVASLLAGRPLLLMWRGHPYLLRGVVYQELVAQNGEKRMEVRELKLADPYDPARAVSFLADRDDPAEIDGTVMLTVTPEARPDWQRQPGDWLREKPK